MDSAHDPYTETAVQVLPEMGIARVRTENVIDLRERAKSMLETVNFLVSHGLELPDADEIDDEIAQKLVRSYAQSPYDTSEAVDEARAATLPPSAVVLTSDILERFGALIADDADRIRNMVVNKLVIETEHKDPRVRLKALELLGKVSDVALFTERRHITVENASENELRSRLRGKLYKLQAKAIDGEYSELPDDDNESG